MKNVEWNVAKSERLKRTRGVSFEEILKAKQIAILDHPSRMSQKVIVYEYKNYCWAVPCIVEESHIFLKTMYPSRKLTRRYLT